jgi:hypothetical protein
MLAAFFRRSCPDTTTLGEYALAMLAPERMQATAAHLLDCPHCLSEVTSYRAFLAEPDDPLRHRGILADLRRLIAQPLASPATALGGLRGAGAPETLRYTAEGLSLTLEVQSAARGRSGRVIAGLLDQDEAAPAAAALLSGGRVVASEAVDDLGTFQFEDVTPGDYQLEVQAGGLLLVVESLAVS